MEDGYQFFEKRSLVTLFSAANYCGEFDNAGAVMGVSEDLTCWFNILPVGATNQVYTDVNKVYILQCKQLTVHPHHIISIEQLSLKMSLVHYSIKVPVKFRMYLKKNISAYLYISVICLMDLHC